MQALKSQLERPVALRLNDPCVASYFENLGADRTEFNPQWGGG